MAYLLFGMPAIGRFHCTLYFTIFTILQLPGNFKIFSVSWSYYFPWVSFSATAWYKSCHLSQMTFLVCLFLDLPKTIASLGIRNQVSMEPHHQSFYSLTQDTLLVKLKDLLNNLFLWQNMTSVYSLHLCMLSGTF